MMKLSGRVESSSVEGPLPGMWTVTTGLRPPRPTDAYLIGPNGVAPSGYQLFLHREPLKPCPPGPALLLPAELGHLGSDDIIAVDDLGTRIAVLWKSTANHSSLLLTEQCDNYCLMCSQPPKPWDDSWLYERAKRVISLLPPNAVGIGLTGGEPTLNAEALLDLLDHCRQVAPTLQLHLLSNGRRFADMDFARQYAEVGNQDLMVGIPIYAPEPALHDYIVQARGAWDETIRGILNLAALGKCVELRIVIQRHTVPVLADLAEFITRNLPFVDQVALMGLEMTGLARPNSAEVWIDPVDYQHELRDAVTILATGHVPVMIYNHQLCVLDRDLWPYAVRSISDWKNDYVDECATCSVRNQCGGVFTTSGPRLSRSIRAIAETS
jgi:His-Xaa-Ser system radical SAM maturase HxsC